MTPIRPEGPKSTRPSPESHQLMEAQRVAIEKNGQKVSDKVVYLKQCPPCPGPPPSLVLGVELFSVGVARQGQALRLKPDPS